MTSPPVLAHFWDFLSNCKVYLILSQERCRINVLFCFFSKSYFNIAEIWMVNYNLKIVRNFFFFSYWWNSATFYSCSIIESIKMGIHAYSKSIARKRKKNGTQTGRIVLTINMVNIYFTERSLCSEGKFIMLLCF